MSSLQVKRMVASWLVCFVPILDPPTAVRPRRGNVYLIGTSRQDGPNGNNMTQHELSAIKYKSSGAGGRS